MVTHVPQDTPANTPTLAYSHSLPLQVKRKLQPRNAPSAKLTHASLAVAAAVAAQRSSEGRPTSQSERRKACVI